MDGGIAGLLTTVVATRDAKEEDGFSLLTSHFPPLPRYREAHAKGEGLPVALGEPPQQVGRARSGRDNHHPGSRPPLVS